MYKQFYSLFISKNSYEFLIYISIILPYRRKFKLNAFVRVWFKGGAYIYSYIFAIFQLWHCSYKSDLAFILSKLQKQIYLDMSSNVTWLAMRNQLRYFYVCRESVQCAYTKKTTHTRREKERRYFCVLIWESVSSLCNKAAHTVFFFEEILRLLSFKWNKYYCLLLVYWKINYIFLQQLGWSYRKCEQMRFLIHTTISFDNNQYFQNNNEKTHLFKSWRWTCSDATPIDSSQCALIFSWRLRIYFCGWYHGCGWSDEMVRFIKNNSAFSMLHLGMALGNSRCAAANV